MMTLNKYVNRIRLSDWRYSFLPLIIGWIYLFILLLKIQINLKALFIGLLFMISSCGFAALGFYINNFFDIDSDKISGKPNSLSKISGKAKIKTFLFIIMLVFIPFLWIPSDYTSWRLIFLEIILFLIYSIPSIRLKEIWYGAGMIDAGYAYLIPFLLCYHTFSLLSNKVNQINISSLCIVFFLSGYSNFLIHQISDLEYDRRSGIKTLPMVLGFNNSIQIVKLCIILEGFFFVNFFLFEAGNYTLGSIIGVLYLSYIIIATNFGTCVSKIHPYNHFYQIYLPLILLIFMVYEQYLVLLILIPHMLIFLPDFVQKPVAHFIKKKFNLLIRYSKNTTYSLICYHIKMMTGEDLAKEKKSVIEYFKRD